MKNDLMRKNIEADPANGQPDIGKDVNIIVAGGSYSEEINAWIASQMLSEEEETSCVVIDTNNTLYDRYSDRLRRRGFTVLSLDLADPDASPNKFNPILLMDTENDIDKLAGKLVRTREDNIWPAAEKAIVKVCLSYIYEGGEGVDCSMAGLLRLLSLFDPEAMVKDEPCGITRLFEKHNDSIKHRFGKDSEAYLRFKRLKRIWGKALETALMYVFKDLDAFDTPELRGMMSHADFDLASVGQDKTAVFVNVSEADRSKDVVVSLFFDLLTKQLFDCAATLPEKRLRVPVRFFLNGLGSTVTIPDFEQTMTGLNSRGISAVISVRSLSQLEKGYGRAAKTILASCPTKIYLGGSDPETASTFTAITNNPPAKLLNMPPFSYWLSRRGESAYFGTVTAPNVSEPTLPRRSRRKAEKFSTPNASGTESADA